MLAFDRLMRRFFIFVLFLPILPVSSLAQFNPIITIQNPSNFDRLNEWVEFGVPLPREWNIVDGQELSLLDAQNAEIPCQCSILARWGAGVDSKSAPAKWILVGAKLSIKTKSSLTLTLTNKKPTAAAANPITIDNSQTGKLLIDVHSAKFEINTGDSFNVLNQIAINGIPLLEPLLPQAAIQYEPDGGVDVVGKTAALDLSPRDARVTVERAGPLSAVIKVEGSILNNASQAVLDFTARLHFQAESAAVRLDFTVENNHPIVEGEGGQPGNAHNQGAVNSVYIGDLSLNLRVKESSGNTLLLTENGVTLSTQEGSLRLNQDSSGGEHWDAYVGQVGWPGSEASAHPRLQSYCQRDGFTIASNALTTPIAGRRSQGWMALQPGENNAPRLLVAVRDFWQNFPKTLVADADGTMAIHLFPNGSQFHHNFRVGEEKTHTILLGFGMGNLETQNAMQSAESFNRPLVPIVAPEWIAKTGVLGETPLVNPTKWPLYEDYVRVAFEPSKLFNPTVDDPNFGNTTLLQSIERYNFFGWQDYGDVPLDYEAFGDNQAGQMNLKYWYLHGMLMQFCRSGDAAWMQLARSAAWHLADIDHLHIPDEGAQHWAHGAYFGHSQHDEPGNLNPNRNANSPSVDLIFGVPDLLLAYYLTGEQRFADTAQEAIQAHLAMMEFVDFNTAVDWESVIQRAQGNLIFAFMEMYKWSGSPQWLETLNSVVQSVTDLSNKGWLTDPAAYGAQHPGFYLKTFAMSQTLWTIGRYLDFLQEYNLPDSLDAAEALRAYGDFILRFLLQEYPAGSGRAAHPYQYTFDGSDSSYLDVNNWALVMADALAYAYKYTQETRFLDAAERFYRTGVIDPVFEGDPPVYQSTKDLVNALNWGMVYMNQAERAASIPQRVWMMYE